MNLFTVTGVVETPFAMNVEAESEFDAENIAYERLYNATDGNAVYVEDVTTCEDEDGTD